MQLDRPGGRDFPARQRNLPVAATQGQKFVLISKNHMRSFAYSLKLMIYLRTAKFNGTVGVFALMIQ